MRRSMFTDNSTHIHYPDTIRIEEKKAPTDESVKLMEEMHNKALQNIIAKVKVENNLINGEAFCIDQPWNINEVKLIFKFSINGKDFTVEREISRKDVGYEDQKQIREISGKLATMAESVMLWYALKLFSASVYEQMTGTEFPKFLLPK